MLNSFISFILDIILADLKFSYPGAKVGAQPKTRFDISDKKAQLYRDEARKLVTDTVQLKKGDITRLAEERGIGETKGGQKTRKRRRKRKSRRKKRKTKRKRRKRKTRKRRKR